MKQLARQLLGTAAVTLAATGLAVAAAAPAHAASIFGAGTTSATSNTDAIKTWASANAPLQIVVTFADAPEGTTAQYQGTGFAKSAYTGEIKLSHSVATDWTVNQYELKALIMHQIGHTTERMCQRQFQGPVFNSDSEAWAVAYAWSQGYTGAGSGAENNGAPTLAELEAVKKCY